MVVSEDVVAIIINLHSGFVGGFESNVSKAWRTVLLKSGPVWTYSTIRSMLSITIREELDLYASRKILSMLFILPNGPIPTYLSGDIIFTKLNFDCLAKCAAIEVVPDP